MEGGKKSLGETKTKSGGSLHGDYRKGALRGLPIVLGYFPIGFAFGILAANAGMSIINATLMSAFVFAGSGQLIAAGMLENQIGILTITITTFLVNLRHLLMSASLAPYLGHLSRLQQALFSFQMTDETFAVHSIDFRNEKIAPKRRIFATNMTAHFGWISSSTLGAWAGSLLTNLEAWGLDYALAAMFIALLVLQLGELKRLLIAIFAVGLSILLYNQLSSHWYIIITTLLAATAGVILDKIIIERQV